LLEGYQSGATPNPDVMCNREIKFGAFLDYAIDQGFDSVATGHYARLDPTAATPSILEGADPNKDQSYFLALMKPKQIAHAVFPVGHLLKPDLRKRALEAGLPNASKKDSQGICFIGNIKMADFLREYVPDRPGPILRAEDDKMLGEHRGLHYFTIGQRKGIGVPSNTDNKNYVVVGKDKDRNALLISFEGRNAPKLYSDSCEISNISLQGDPLPERCRIECKVRYRDPRVPIEYQQTGDGKASIKFEDSQRALAIGQIMALYDGPKLLGGGVYTQIN
ncbi:MAG: tRNA 2-thiouridine(34) synthase MnmA, partial [Symploca sp. SIO2D2]|nr:tRNA 2-thiouridine(34) synthase MnmA [Symploca sp. SIO2D2]